MTHPLLTCCLAAVLASASCRENEVRPPPEASAPAERGAGAAPADAEETAGATAAGPAATGDEPAGDAARPEKQPAGKPLAMIIGGAAQVQVIEIAAEGDPASRRATLEAPEQVREVIGGLNPGQTLSAEAPDCRFALTLTFADRAGHGLGTVGLCRSEEAPLPAAYRGAGGVTAGLEVPDPKAFRSLLGQHLAQGREKAKAKAPGATE